MWHDAYQIPPKCYEKEWLKAHSHALSRQKARQRAVALAVGAHHLAVDDLAVFHIVDLELFGAAEMLEDLAAGVSDCNSHGIASFLSGPFGAG